MLALLHLPFGMNNKPLLGIMSISKNKPAPPNFDRSHKKTMEELLV
jgi:hypothetical protein